MEEKPKYNIPIPGPGRDSFKEKHGEDFHRFQARIPKTLFNALSKKATAENVSINDYLIQLIEADMARPRSEP